MLDLLARARPLEPVTLPDGAVLTVRALNADGWELYRTVQRTQSDTDALALLRHILPDATDANLESLGAEDVATLFLYAARKIHLVLDAVGNSSGTSAASHSPPSSPPPTPSTS